MKKTFILFLSVCMALVVVTSVLSAKETSRREIMLSKYLPIRTEQDLLQAAANGNLYVLRTLEDSSLLTATDKFGNNCLHLAKDAATVEVLTGRLQPVANTGNSILKRLRDQRNHVGETPLMAHINRGQSDTFFLLYRGSSLADDIRQTKQTQKGALRIIHNIKKSIALENSKDNSGRTVAQAANANAQAPGMNYVIRFFQQEAPYLF